MSEELLAATMIDLPGSLAEAVRRRLEDWEGRELLARLWAKDPSLWSAEELPELADRLGWLDLPHEMATHLRDFEAFAAEVAADGLERIVLLGMGGSSLAPEVFQRCLGNRSGYPSLTILDSTHPAAVETLDRSLSLERTLFVVSSKSGTTVETLSFLAYFQQRLESIGKPVGDHFVAITDPATSLEELARERSFRRVFPAPPEVGGRYSALSPFGMVPAALIGADMEGILAGAGAMARLCAPGRETAPCPPLVLGAALGEAALVGRNKLTLMATPALASFPDWVEQLVAESTGKQGLGILPVAHEPRLPLEELGSDRIFVALTDDPGTDGYLDDLAASGHPVLRFGLAHPADLGAEMFRWEVAVAAAGIVLGIQPFDQPDVQLAKSLAREAMAGGGAGGEAAGDRIPMSREPALRQALEQWRGQVTAGGYVSVQAYLAPTPELEERLEELAAGLRRVTGLPVTVGFGPRFLHSTGQLHKGGPPGGLFLQLIDEPAPELTVPSTSYTFGELISAQAAGDAGALRQRGRTLLRVAVGERADRDVAVLTRLLDG